MSNMRFRVMAFWLRLRERFGDPSRRLVGGGLRRGQSVLDFGCGIGSFTIPAAQIVGEEGVVYALDIHPLAIEAVERRANREKIANIRTIVSDRETGLPDESVDVILLYDVLHAVQDKQVLLKELHRVLKPDGLLSVIPDHVARDDLFEIMHTENLFSLQAQREEAFNFGKRANVQREYAEGQ